MSSTYTVAVTEPVSVVTVEEGNPAAVSVAVAGVITSHTSLLAVWAHPDTLSVRTGQGKFYFPVVATLIGVSITVGTAPVGADVIVDLNLDGTTIFTDQANRPRILSGQTVSGETTLLDVTAVAKGQYLTADIDQIGSTVPGADLTVTVRYRIS